ncbi:MAG: sulfatase [Polyangiaceae bacterium]|nr:sulfatase [Polyangiaceae bacterium]
MKKPTAPGSAGVASPFVAALVQSAWGGVLAIFIQGLAALIFSSDGLASSWEFFVGFRAFAPFWFLGAAFFGVFALPFGIDLGLVSGSRDGVERGAFRASAIAPLLLLTGFALGVGYGVGGGRHLATPALRWGFGLFLALLAVLAYLVLRPRVRQLLSMPRGGLVVLAGAVLLDSANRLLLVRLYPAFHLGLSLAIWVFAGVFALIVFRTATRRSAFFLLLLALAAGCSLVPASRAARNLDNFRWWVSEVNPALALAIPVISSLAPPEPLASAALARPLGQARSEPTLSMVGRDILLITVDALRADHLGLYGYSRATSPHLDAFAKDAAIFESAYAATPHTSYSLTSLMTGKYMRPLLLQGAGQDSILWADLFRQYGYRTAAFYPPAIFFIDPSRFSGFEKRHLGFEFYKVEFLEGQPRVNQLKDYLAQEEPGQRVFSWVHLFGPHEPYEKDPRFDFGREDIDIYDSEIRAADETIGGLIETFRKRDPKGVIIVSADHGEEFGDHGGRYHGTTVYDEQVRVPLLISAPGLISHQRVSAPVQTVDILPTVLSGLDIPIPPTIRGRDLLPTLEASKAADKQAETDEFLGEALAETDQQTLLAQGKWRLICQKASGACRLFDSEEDPQQLVDRSREHPEVASRLKTRARQLAVSHGRFEENGLRQEGKGWPSAINRGLSGDASARHELGALLDDADQQVRERLRNSL